VGGGKVLCVPALDVKAKRAIWLGLGNLPGKGQ
jgi:hypothetical protein